MMPSDDQSKELRVTESVQLGEILMRQQTSLGIMMRRVRSPTSAVASEAICPSLGTKAFA